MCGVYAWEDAEVRELLEGLAELPGLKQVKIVNFGGGCTAQVSAELLQELASALHQRGGELYYVAPGSGAAKRIEPRAAAWRV